MGGRETSRCTHPINDCWIAATCLTEGLRLATFNTKDYEDIAANYGLSLISLPR